jgi:hypothetical protein
VDKLKELSNAFDVAPFSEPDKVSGMSGSNLTDIQKFLSIPTVRRAPVLCWRFFF